MSISREEVEKTVTDFQKIVVRGEKKPASRNIKIFLIVTCLVIVAIMVLGYYYIQKGKKGKDGKSDKKKGVLSMGGGEANVAPSGSIPVQVVI